MATDIAALDEALALDAVAELLRRSVVEESANGAVRFVHDSLRELSYEALDRLERQAFHRRAADALESAGTAESAVLARHWQGAGEPGRARVGQGCSRS